METNLNACITVQITMSEWYSSKMNNGWNAYCCGNGIIECLNLELLENEVKVFDIIPKKDNKLEKSKAFWLPYFFLSTYQHDVQWAEIESVTAYNRTGTDRLIDEVKLSYSRANTHYSLPNSGIYAFHSTKDTLIRPERGNSIRITGQKYFDTKILPIEIFSTRVKPQFVVEVCVALFNNKIGESSVYRKAGTFHYNPTDFYHGTIADPTIDTYKSSVFNVVISNIDYPSVKITRVDG